MQCRRDIGYRAIARENSGVAANLRAPAASKRLNTTEFA